MMTITQAAERLGVSRSLLYELVRQGRIGHSRRGLGRGRILFTDEDLTAYEASTRVQPFAPPQVTTFKHLKLN